MTYKISRDMQSCIWDIFFLWTLTNKGWDMDGTGKDNYLFHVTVTERIVAGCFIFWLQINADRLLTFLIAFKS